MAILPPLNKMDNKHSPSGTLLTSAPKPPTVPATGSEGGRVDGGGAEGGGGGALVGAVEK